MPNGKINSVHPLLTKGDQLAGQRFVNILVDVVDVEKHRIARGFDSVVLDQIKTGSRAVSKDDVQQLRVDYYAAYPKRAASGHKDYRWLRTLLDGSAEISTCHQPLLKKVNKSEDIRHIAPNRVHAAKPSLGLKPTVPQSPPMLFELGDSLIGYSWIRMLRKYVRVYRDFKAEFGITPEQEKAVELGRLGVPISVHLALMQKIEERLSEALDPKIPKSHLKLRKITASLPAELKRLDHNLDKDWFHRS